MNFISFCIHWKFSKLENFICSPSMTQYFFVFLIWQILLDLVVRIKNFKFRRSTLYTQIFFVLWIHNGEKKEPIIAQFYLPVGTETTRQVSFRLKIKSYVFFNAQIGSRSELQGHSGLVKTFWCYIFFFMPLCWLTMPICG